METTLPSWFNLTFEPKYTFGCSPYILFLNINSPPDNSYIFTIPALAFSFVKPIAIIFPS